MAKKKKLTGDALEKRMKSDIEAVLAAGLAVMERKNNSKSSSAVNHLTIIGGVRRVDYYPSTGTVFANRVNDKFKPCRGTGVKDAIRIAKKGR
ncbi:hypothetical protein VPHD81_0111 [Vibrio phage D81]